MTHSFTIADPAPLLGPLMQEPPFLLRLGTGSDLPQSLLLDQSALQRHVESFFAGGCRYGIGAYLENREPLLRNFPQMTSEKRFWHLGLDIVAPAGTTLLSPLEGTVHESGFEAGDGNYGGYTVLRYTDDDGESFFCLFGHLNRFHLPAQGASITRSSPFAIVGGRESNGGWFTHTHMQLLTPEALAEGWLHKGYCTEEQLPLISSFCPDPGVMLRRYSVSSRRIPLTLT